MIITSNLDTLDEHIRQLLDTFNFEVSVGNMSLGKRMAEKTAEMIQSRSVQFQKGADVQWDANKSPYKEWKERKYNVYDLAGVRTGQMLSHESLLGETTVAGDEVQMVYGTDRPPTRSVSSSYFSDADGKITDRKKAEYFTDGNANQAARPFYELDADVADQVFDLVVEAVDKILKGP